MFDIDKNCSIVATGKILRAIPTFDHTWYLSFLLHRQIFKSKIWHQKNYQKHPPNTKNSLKKYIICSFCVQSWKFYTGTARGARDKYQVCKFWFLWTIALDFATRCNTCWKLEPVWKFELDDNDSISRLSKAPNPVQFLSLRIGLISVLIIFTFHQSSLLWFTHILNIFQSSASAENIPCHITSIMGVIHCMHIRHTRHTQGLRAMTI